jgi:hypothetical protein
MVEKGLHRLSWGFIFIMLSFRINGFDILPDVVGFLLFASAFGILSSNSDYFVKASKYNLPMVILSVFSIYQRPAQEEGIQFGPLGLLSIPIAIFSFVLNLVVVYYLFMGIKDMAIKGEQSDIVLESDGKWNAYKIFQIAVVLSFVMVLIPPLAFVYIIVLLIISIILTASIVGFIKRCSRRLS